MAVTSRARGRRLVPVAAAIFVACGLFLTGCSGVSPQEHTRQNPTDHATSRLPKVLSRSVPTSISIPAIHVKSKLIRLGLNDDRTVEVPQPGPDYNKAGWYKNSPTPGQRGPAVILGHIDSAEDGPSVFFHLGELSTGDKVRVARNNHSTAVFTIDHVNEYAKSDFPTKKIYGNTKRATLRLITCGGKFDREKKSYEDNIVAFGHLTESVR